MLWTPDGASVSPTDHAVSLLREGRHAEVTAAIERDAARRLAQQEAETRAYDEEMARLEVLRQEDSAPLDLGSRIERT